MGQIGEKEFRDAIIATKKDAKLVAAARNERTSSAEGMYREFLKVPVDRQREIINALSAENFVGAQWKIAYILNNLPPAILSDALAAAGKALFYSRNDD